MSRSRSGSNARQRSNDVRIRLSAEEIIAFDEAVATAGFQGPTARGDWLRAQIGVEATSPRRETPAHQRVPLRGGQALLAELGRAGVSLTKISALMHAIGHEYISPQDAEHSKGKLSAWVGDALQALTDAVHKVDVHLDQLGPR